MQGIGFFDGPLESIRIENNVIMSFAWPGISLYDSNNGTIINNILFTPAQIDKVASQITLGSKNNDGNNSNTLTNNTAYDFIISNSTLLTRSGNKTILPGTGKNLFTNSLNLRITDINALYGDLHPVSNQPRINANFMLNGTSSIF
jgi:parallel beta-helix repeat protein